MDPQFLYRAKVVRVYDGDTMTVDIDLGMHTWQKDVTLRLFGIDTPELRGEEREDGIKVRDRVRELCPVGSEVTVQTIKDKKGKYGRWLAIIYTDALDIDLNAWLIERGMADPY